MKNKTIYLEGIRAGLPIAVGYFPIAIAFGALAGQAQLAWIESTLMSVIVYAGASQFVGVSMIISEASAIQIITTTFFLNLRHTIMSLAINDRMRPYPKSLKYFLSFFITDESFALITLGETKRRNQEIAPGYMAGLMLTAYLGWVIGTVLGGIGAGFISGEITTAMVAGLYGLFIGLLVPPARKSVRFAMIALVSMLINWSLAMVIDQGWAIILATVFAAGLGIVLLKEDE
jgi:4-azaleucine resistance transporter AzlC